MVCPSLSHMYDDVAGALAAGMSVEQIQVNIPAVRGMDTKALKRLARKVTLPAGVPGRHGVHGYQKRKITGEHIDFLLSACARLVRK